MIIIRNLDAIIQGDNQNEISLTVERRVLAKRRWRGQAEDGTDFGFDLISPLRNGICFHRPLTSNWSLETDEWNAFNSDIWKIEPVPNTLLIFPSLLQHSILKNKSDKNRYSIAFNVLPTGRFGQGDSTIYISAK